MKVLFVIRHTGYLRHYEPVIEELARRGHHVHMGFNAFPRKAHLGREQIDRLCRECPNVTTSIVPDRQGIWRPVLYYVRGLRDYLRFLHPRYDRAPKLRERARVHVGRIAAFLVACLPGIQTVAGQERYFRFLTRVENAIPSSWNVERNLRGLEPDVVLVTPLVDFGSKQLDHLKSAQKLGIRNGLCVASWDNLTNKGIIQLEPEMVIVWNEDQLHEAVDLHGIPPFKIRVTGAQSWDKWFTYEPSTTRERFCSDVGLDPRKPIILYLCSSGFIAKEEGRFVEKWLAALRASGDPVLRDAGILVRPHPLNADQWAAIDLSRFGQAAVYPRGGAYVTTNNARAVFFDSIHHSAAVVGINTSAMIEAGIVGRVSHTIVTDDFADTQEGTLHFDYLVRDGFVKVARDLAEHARQLRGTLDAGPDGQEHVRSFIQRFVRPQGLDRASTPLVADAIEELAKMPIAPVTLAKFGPAVEWLVLTPIAFAGWCAEYLYRACRKTTYTWLSGVQQLWGLATGRKGAASVKKAKPVIHVGTESEPARLRKSA